MHGIKHPHRSASNNVGRNERETGVGGSCSNGNKGQSQDSVAYTLNQSPALVMKAKLLSHYLVPATLISSSRPSKATAVQVDCDPLTTPHATTGEQPPAGKMGYALSTLVLSK